MGSLDDAIREHLELKRRLGATEDELKEKEAEAFGKGNRPASPKPEAAQAPDPAPAAEPFVEDELAAAEPAPNGQHTEEWDPADFADSTQRARGAEEIFEPDEVPADESLTVRDARRVQEDLAEEPPEEDVLEETPEFLEETPEQDRLWFEQRPPKDFDFD
jgi:hypothetical protein